MSDSKDSGNICSNLLNLIHKLDYSTKKNSKSLYDLSSTNGKVVEDLESIHLDFSKQIQYNCPKNCGRTFKNKENSELHFCWSSEDIKSINKKRKKFGRRTNTIG